MQAEINQFSKVIELTNIKFLNIEESSNQIKNWILQVQTKVENLSFSPEKVKELDENFHMLSSSIQRNLYDLQFLI